MLGICDFFCFTKHFSPTWIEALEILGDAIPNILDRKIEVDYTYALRPALFFIVVMDVVSNTIQGRREF